MRVVRFTASNQVRTAPSKTSEIMEILYPCVFLLCSFFTAILSFVFFLLLLFLCLKSHKNVLEKNHNEEFVDLYFFCGSAWAKHFFLRKGNNTIPKGPTNTLIEDYMEKYERNEDEEKHIYIFSFYFPFNLGICQAMCSIPFTSRLGNNNVLSRKLLLLACLLAREPSAMFFFAVVLYDLASANNKTEKKRHTVWGENVKTWKTIQQAWRYRLSAKLCHSWLSMFCVHCALTTMSTTTMMMILKYELRIRWQQNYDKQNEVTSGKIKSEVREISHGNKTVVIEGDVARTIRYAQYHHAVNCETVLHGLALVHLPKTAVLNFGKM